MPSLVTHALAGHKMIPENCFIATCIKENSYAFNIGTSGPDLFYFYHALPWSKKEHKDEIYEYGSWFHDQYINDTFKTALEFAKASQDKTMVAYMAGWLTHYALDRNCHPYIFHKTGENSMTHRRFEAELDASMLKHVLNTSIKDYKPYELIDNDNKTIEAIYKLYAKCFKDVYSIDLCKEIIHDSIKDMRFSYRLLHDPKGTKRKWIQKLEKNPYEYTGTMLNAKENLNDDILNLKHQEWCNPCDNKLTSTDDFLTLFNNGIEDGKLLLTLFNNYVSGNLPLIVLIKQIKEIDYCTGLPNHPEMKYYNPIY